MVYPRLARLARSGAMVLVLAMVAGGCAGRKRPPAPATAPAAQCLSEELRPIRLSNDTVHLIIDPAKGRIMLYGFVHGPNVLWTSNKAVELAGEFGGWRNWGGDKTWPWPESVWGWPPPVPDTPWHCVTKKDGAVEMASPVLPVYGLRMCRRVELAPRGTTVTITSWFEAEEGTAGKPVAMWAITQVPTTDMVLVRSAPAAGGIHLPVAENPGRPPFQVQTLTPRVAWFKRDPNGMGKLQTDADAILCAYDDFAFVERDLTQPVSIGTYDPLSRGQVYTHPDWATNIPVRGRSYLELEFISPTVPLSALGPMELKVQWSLVKLNAKNSTPQALAEMLEKME